ncbi:MAG: VWA domain-containing protein [Bacteroidota bacterium]
MFRFEEPFYLAFLWVIPILGLLYWVALRWRSRQLKKLGSETLLNRLFEGYSAYRSHVRLILISAVLLALIFAWANPQWGNKKEKVQAQSSDVFVALDISQSMMAEDISPNRLERAKRLTQNLIRALRGNRIGLIYFAGNAYLQMPLSNDYSAAQLFVSTANTRQASTQGTAISEAIDLAQRAYQDDKPNQRALIIITDGEDHDSDAIAKAKEASADGLSIFSIGVGTTDGAFIPFQSGGGEQYKRDAEGNPVKSSLNADLINDLADEGRGDSYLIGEGNTIITGIKRAVDQLEKRDVEQLAFTDYASYFQYFIAVALLLLVLDTLIPEGQKRRNLTTA